MSIVSLLLNGLSLGSVYALIALGYTMVYGIAKMLNFAHGDVIMVGSIVIFQAVQMTGLSPLIGFVLGVVACTVLGVVVEKVAYRPLREASSLAVLITAIGVSYLLENIVLLTFGSQNKSLSFEFMRALDLHFGELTISGETWITIAVTVILMVALTLFVQLTKTGKAMRAVSEDRGAARLMGVNVNRTISITFAIGSALAGVAGFLYIATYTQVGAYIGIMPGIKAFTAAVLGGIGSIPGAMIGGLVLGLIEQISKFVLSDFQLAALADAVVFVVLIVVLLVKPTGLLGRKIDEKV